MKIKLPFKIFLSCLLLLILGVVGVIVDILKFSRPAWPAISDEGRLISDAQFLISSHPTADLTPAEWPESMRKLHPLSVTVGEHEFVEVVISAGGIGQPYSYVIFRTPSDAQSFKVPYRKLHPTKSPLIFTLS